MVFLGLEPSAAGLKASTSPLSYGGPPNFVVFSFMEFSSLFRAGLKICT